MSDNTDYARASLEARVEGELLLAAERAIDANLSATAFETWARRAYEEVVERKRDA
jgi:hypothetical protein